MKLTAEDLVLLQKLVVLNGWYVCSANLVTAGRLVSAGLAQCWDDYEGPQLAPTDKGIAAALRRNIARRSTAEELKEPYSRAYKVAGGKWLDDRT